MNIFSFQWIPKQKESLFDVSLLLGSYAGLIFHAFSVFLFVLVGRPYAELLHCN